ncbi:hypothetical protein TNCV_1299371 [Trichonephila clavipes]|nr:hypothetical protein TNCV_1299371 [Trichonephila clavipes]
MKSVVYANPVVSEEALVARIAAVVGDMREMPRVFANVRQSLCRRCEACIFAGGGSMEQFSFFRKRTTSPVPSGCDLMVTKGIGTGLQAVKSIPKQVVMSPERSTKAYKATTSAQDPYLELSTRRHRWTSVPQPTRNLATEFERIILSQNSLKASSRDWTLHLSSSFVCLFDYIQQE